jgi:tRNA (cytidine/uridine-2'-O-)-methyltransferase
VRLVLFQPDIAPNMGAAMRLCACLGVGLDVVEPCGFPLSDKALKRASLDYGPLCEVVRHDDWAAFVRSAALRSTRLVSIETDADAPLHQFTFQPGDSLVLGRETAGTPDHVRLACAGSAFIPMRPGARSMNVIVAGAIALGEALRQTNGWSALA